MSHAKPQRTKRYRPHDSVARTLRTQPWKLNGVFHPLENILSQMEVSGFSDVDQHATPIFQSAKDSCWYTSAPAINGVADAYDIHAQRSGRSMPTQALRLVAEKLHSGHLVISDDVDAMRAALLVLRSETMGMTENYAHSLLQSVQIKIEIEKTA